MLKYKAKKGRHEKRKAKERPRESTSFVAPWRASCGYSWIARSLSARGRPSTVCFHPVVEAPEPCRKYRRRRVLKAEEDRELDHLRRFWDRAKKFYAEVDAFPLAVESPTPFKNRNRGHDVEKKVEQIENQRKRLQPLPDCYSISDALNGVLYPLESTQKATPGRERCDLENPLSLMRPSGARSGIIIDPRDLICASKEEIHDQNLQALLDACDQSMGTSTGLPSMESLLGESFDLGKMEKIGEGTFGEAFKSGEIVVKIVPFGGAKLVCGYPQKEAQELLPEIMTSKILSSLNTSKSEDNSCGGFALTHKTKICQGPYPDLLIKEWHRWSGCFQSENDPIDGFPAEQEYLLFFIEDGGSDLERFEVRNFEEAKSIVLQTVMNLAVAEEACYFEHRDLHWGNLLLTRTPENHFRMKFKGQEIEVQSSGVKTTLIDFSLSRIQSEELIIYRDLNLEPDLFTGAVRDHQAETYRRMKKAVKEDWNGFHPETNCFWIHYLVETILNLKKMEFSVKEKQEIRAFKRRCLKCGSCGELIWDDLLKSEWIVK